MAAYGENPMAAVTPDPYGTGRIDCLPWLGAAPGLGQRGPASGGLGRLPQRLAFRATSSPLVVLPRRARTRTGVLLPLPPGGSPSRSSNGCRLSAYDVTPAIMQTHFCIHECDAGRTHQVNQRGWRFG